MHLAGKKSISYFLLQWEKGLASCGENSPNMEKEFMCWKAKENKNVHYTIFSLYYGRQKYCNTCSTFFNGVY